MILSIDTVLSSVKTRHLYTALLVGYAFDCVNNMVVSPLIMRGILDIPLIAFGLFQFLIILLMNGIALMIVRRFIDSNSVFSLFTLSIFLSIFFLFTTESPAGASLEPSMIRNLRIAGISTQLISLTTILYVAVRDIFQEKHDTFYCLTGATVIFLMIATIFGILYCLLEVTTPGIVIPNGTNRILNDCVSFSFCILSGQDPQFEVDPVVKNISIFESIFANLYSIMVVGRLLSK